MLKKALADPALRIRVLDQQPFKTLDEALAIVTRMEAYSGNTACEDNVTINAYA